MNIIAIFFLVSGILLSIFVYFDTKKHKQSMPIMRIIWTLTMLWSSWIGLGAYLSFGRQKDTLKPMMNMDNNNMSSMSMDNGTMTGAMPSKKAKWQSITLSTLHCGAGCVLADIIGETLAGILGVAIITGWSIDYMFALIFGVYFQYMAIKQMGKVTLKMAIDKAIKADFLSLTAWQIGMYGFMGIYIQYSATSVNRASVEFWFIMQLAMIAGFIVSYPMNILLIKIGLKNAM